MPFGVAGAPAVQERVMDTLSAGMKWLSAFAYLDDIVIYHKTFQEHRAHLESLFEKCQKGYLQLNPAKSTLCRAETTYLEYIVSHQMVKPNPIKIEPKPTSPVPKDRKAVRQLLGVVSYYRRFIQDYVKRADPSQKLVSRDVKFGWEPDQQRAFEDIKHALCTATLMRHPNSRKPFINDCDASLIRSGAALHQRDNNLKEYLLRLLANTTP